VADPVLDESPILRQQIVGKSMPDYGLERLSSQPAPPVARVTEHLELRDPAGPALIAGRRNNLPSRAQPENARV
jgi:hypothetical protein